MFLYDIATYLHDVLTYCTEGLDRFRGLPSYARFGRSDHTQKRHGTTLRLRSSKHVAWRREIVEASPRSVLGFIPYSEEYY